jgi:hypothetical protein
MGIDMKATADYGYGRLDATRGRDGYRILDWLSAMVNAHVDVAKDPYILTLNVNSATYNAVMYLIRRGIGRATFLYMSQPILKQYADMVMALNGTYGVSDTANRAFITSQLYQMYAGMLKQAISRLPRDMQLEWKRKFNGLGSSVVGEKNMFTDSDILTTIPMQNSEVFNERLLTHALNSFNNKVDGVPQYTVEDLYVQLVSLKAYQNIQTDGNKLSKFVNLSQIDTKKYGNNIAQQLNFINKFELFR